MDPRLIQRFRNVQALYAGASTDGEREAAASACSRLLARIEEDQPEPTGPDGSSARFAERLPLFVQLRPSDLRSYPLLLAMLRRYGLKPVRLVKRRFVAVCADSKEVVVEALLPEFERMGRRLRSMVESWAIDAITAALFGGEAAEVRLIAAPAGKEDDA